MVENAKIKKNWDILSSFLIVFSLFCRYITYYDACRQLEYKPVKLYLKDIVLDPMPTFATTGSQCYVYFEVTQRGRKDTYVSKHYLSRKGDRNVSLSVNPPLLLSEDVKFEFYTKQKFGEQLWGNSKMKFARSGEKVFHFWLNTFFVDMELEGGLAHDLTASNSIEAGRGQGGHVHHASGSSEDSSTDDVPLRPHLPPPSKAASNSNGVKFDEKHQGSNEVSCHHPLNHTEAANEVSNLIKHASISDDHLLQDRKTRQVNIYIKDIMTGKHLFGTSFTKSCKSCNCFYVLTTYKTHCSKSLFFVQKIQL